MKDLMDALARSPWTMAALAAVLAGLALLAGGVAAFVGGGALAKAATTLIAVAVWLLGLQIARYARALFTRNDARYEAITNDPLSLAVLRGSFAIGGALITAFVFG
ncbi:hypothetical protein [Marinicauda sp. Alg238-R41]|uniref:hypothetical protein n=1 Tax=Marinicauda sp. Alg238-R41 TaxID=2993447 RepID=UPI0022E27A85|nr:hypothetical protein [Marinicauda sp. Alg238-R41]